jgi:hypothetical protein
VGSGEPQDRSAGGGLLPERVTLLATQRHRDAIIDLSRLSGIVFQRVTNEESVCDVLMLRGKIVTVFPASQKRTPT